MAFIQADLDRINTAIASGVLEVRFSDRTIRYQSTADLLRAKNEIEIALSTAGGSAIVRQIRPVTGSGW